MGDSRDLTEPPATPLPRTIRFGRALCGELDTAERREWWLPNGRGGYAAGTVAGSLTRSYHGLLVAPVQPPLGRMLLLAKAEPTLIDGGRAWPLFTNRWTGGAIDPCGHVHIESFHLDGRLPVWTFAIGALRIEQRIWLDHGRDQVHCAWRRLAGGPQRPLQLRVALLVGGRDHHQVTGPRVPAPAASIDDGRLVVRWPGLPVLRIAAAGGELCLEPVWIDALDLPIERARGLPDRDRHWRAGQAELSLPVDGGWCGITAAVGDITDAGADGLAASLEHHQRRDRDLLDVACGDTGPLGDAPDWIRQLVLAADGFLFHRPLPDAGDGLSVIAGYPWFGDWGRDTMIALPGLCLATGRADAALRILRTFGGFVRDGLLPNLFPGSGETAAYHSVDAPLWFIQAWRAWHEAGGDDAALAEALPVLASIVAAYRDGTDFGIGTDPADGLVRASSPGLQLSWMDAKAGDWVVTPRAGKPVEVNALWYNALDAMVQFCRELGEDAASYVELAAQAHAGFQRYRRGDGRGLLDVLDGPDGDDLAIRPNQVFAVSLPASPLDARAQAGVVAEVAEHLLTSYGLRTLSPADPSYQGRYRGDVVTRDGAYHQGTVWPWLLGHFALAEHRLTGDAALARARLRPLADHLADAGLGSISEILDGQPPHRPRGAPAQAWSVACTLEAWWRLAHGRYR